MERGGRQREPHERREQRARVGAETRGLLHEAAAWVREHVPDLPEPFAIAALQAVRYAYGVEGTTPELVRVRCERRVPEEVDLHRRALARAADGTISYDAAWRQLEREEPA